MTDLTQFKGQTAVFTGAASGMGLCASRLWCAAGGNVVMCDINGEALERLVAEITAAGPGTAYACKTDVRVYAEVEKAAALALEKTGRIDFIVPFAGGYEPRMRGTLGIPFYEQPIEVIDWGIGVNLMGAVYLARACMPAMVKARRGVICCIGSVSGFEGSGEGAMYGTAKSGLYNFTRALAMAGAPHGVRAFCVAPGPVMTRPGMANMKTALGRQSQPEEIVDFIFYLGQSPSVTGTVHLMDCGRLVLPLQ